MSNSEEHDLVLDSVDHLKAQLAKGLLDEAGIPCIFHGPDFDVVELGQMAHSNLRGISVYVPRGAGDKARSVLAEAWGEEE